MCLGLSRQKHHLKYESIERSVEDGEACLDPESVIRALLAEAHTARGRHRLVLRVILARHKALTSPSHLFRRQHLRLLQSLHFLLAAVVEGGTNPPGPRALQVW